MGTQMVGLTMTPGRWLRVIECTICLRWLRYIGRSVCPMRLTYIGCFACVECGRCISRMRCLARHRRGIDRKCCKRLIYCLIACVNWGVSNVALSAPPVLAIASEPLASSCRQDSAGQLEGPALVRVPSKPDQAGTLYQSAMQTADWSGSFTRYVMAPGTGGLSQAKQAVWDAGALLTGSANRAPSPPPERRNLHTSIIQADGTLVMVPFAWEALSPEQRAQLEPASDGSGPQRLAWLRGERSGEGALFRTRNSILGNSVHSTPVYVGQSSQALAPARPDMLYLGANDGMLHAFNAADGAELFAYVPAALFGALHRLADKDYVHRAYVDGPAQAGDVMIAGSARTVLVSGMGGGAQGVFALDITDPARFAEQGGVLWEFTDRHDPNIGNVTSAPQLAKLRVGTYGGAPVYRYFAVVASGLNNYAADGNASPSGDGALFLLALDKPRNAPWRLNDNYYRLRTPIADATLPNALHAPALVNDRQGAARYAYAGDLQGNLWRFDLAAGPSWSLATQAGQAVRTGQTGQVAQTVRTGQTWQVAQTVRTGQVIQTVRTGQMGQIVQTVQTDQVVPTVQTGQTQLLADNVSLSPLFVARDASGRRQPIAQQPQVAYANDGGYLVLFGTGKLIEQTDRDPARFAPQTYYAIRDSLRTPPELVSGRRQLTRRELKGDPASDRLAIEGEAMAPGSMGWYMDLLASSNTGERSLDSGVQVNGALVFNTVLPANEGGQPGQPGQSGQPGTPATQGTPTNPATPTTPGNPGASCSPAHSRTYVLNVLTGLALDQSVTARLPPTSEPAPPVVAERTTRYVPRPLLLPVPSIKPPTPREPTGRVNLEQDFAIGAPGPQGEPVLGTVNTRKRAGRLSWREVANWRQLHQAYQEPQANQANQANPAKQAKQAKQANPANPAKQADYAKQAHQVYRVNQAHQADRANQAHQAHQAQRAVP